MKDSKHFNLLGVTLDPDIRSKAKEFLHGKIIHLDFTDEQEVDKIPREKLAELSAVCVPYEVKGQLRLAVWKMVKTT